MNKCHVPITWVNDQTPAINDTHLNQYDGELDTLDDRIITLDGTKALQSDLLLAFKDVSLDATTGIITFTLFNNTTKTIDTLLEKVAINFDYDDDPTSPHYQNLIIELEDGTYKYIDMSALITEYEFDTSSTIAFTVANDGTVTADVIDGSISSSKLDPALATPIANAEANGLKSEGFAVGEQNGVPVTSGSPYYQNNAKYYKEQAAAIVNMSFSGLSDTDFNNLQDGQVPVYDANSGDWINADVQAGLLPHVIVISETGSVVTLTKGAKVISATETSTGHFEADVDEYGTWTIDAVLSGDDAQVTLNVDDVKVYTVDDSHFNASITVSYPGAGTCSLSATGQTTLYATSSPYTFVVHDAATYTLSCTYNGVTRTQTYVISTSGQTETYSFLVDGSTATANDVRTWLDCALLWDKAYTTVAEIIADSATLLALISDTNAADYMARSTTFTTAVCADELAMLYIGQYNYCADALLADNTWLSAICNSEYFELVLNVKVPTMTSNTTPNGSVLFDSVWDNDSTKDGYKAFDGDNNTWYWPAKTPTAQGATPYYCGYEFTAAHKFYYCIFNISAITAPARCSNLEIQADDNNAWVTQYTWSGEVSDGQKTLLLSGINTQKLRLYGLRALNTYNNTDYYPMIFNNVQFYGRQDVTAPASRTLKSFATATDAEILEMVCKADRGEIDLADDAGWVVGQEHQISLSSIAASGTYDGVSWTVGESQSAQTVTLVLMHKGLYELVNSVKDKQGQTRNTCSFIVGTKDVLGTAGYYNSTGTNAGSWDGCARRSWCNGGFRSAVPSTLRGAFKQFKTITAQTYNGSTNQVSNDYFAIQAEKEVLGSDGTRANATEAAALTQFTYYETSSNRIKSTGYWDRSPISANNNDICVTSSAGTGGSRIANNLLQIAAFGCM